FCERRSRRTCGCICRRISGCHPRRACPERSRIGDLLFVCPSPFNFHLVPNPKAQPEYRNSASTHCEVQAQKREATNPFATDPNAFLSSGCHSGRGCLELLEGGICPEN